MGDRDDRILANSRSRQVAMMNPPVARTQWTCMPKRQFGSHSNPTFQLYLNVDGRSVGAWSDIETAPLRSPICTNAVDVVRARNLKQNLMADSLAGASGRN